MKRLLKISLILFLACSVFGQGKSMMGTPIDISHPLSDFVLYLPMWESSGNKVFDLSGNNNTGTLMADTHWVPGKFGPALAFDGTGDYVDCGVGTWGAHFTKIIWIKSYVTDTGYNVMGGSAYGSWRLERTQLYGQFGYYDWGLIGGGNVTSDYLMTINSKFEWTQVVITYDGAVVKMYINGLWSASSAATSGTPNADALYFGRKENSYWYGLLDIPMIYNRALSASEIALLHREPFCMFQQDVPLMSVEEAPPPGRGQVIMITSLPLLFIGLYLCRKSKEVL